MRIERTGDEQRAIEAIKKYILQRGITVEEDSDITDRPDALLILPGRRAACECRILSPEKILRMHGIKMQEGDRYRAFLPIEPHMWIRKAIEAKDPKVAEYKTRTNASEAWLILHAKAGFFQHLVDEVCGKYFDIAMMATHQIYHSFDYIFVVTSGGDVGCIFAAPESSANQAKFRNWRVTTISVQIMGLGMVKATAGPDGQGVITVNMNAPHNVVKCQPLDKDFDVDYSNVDALDFANIGNDNPGPQLVAKRKESNTISDL